MKLTNIYDFTGATIGAGTAIPGLNRGNAYVPNELYIDGSGYLRGGDNGPPDYLTTPKTQGVRAVEIDCAPYATTLGKFTDYCILLNSNLVDLQNGYFSGYNLRLRSNGTLQIFERNSTVRAFLNGISFTNGVSYRLRGEAIPHPGYLEINLKLYDQANPTQPLYQIQYLDTSGTYADADDINFGLMKEGNNSAATAGGMIWGISQMRIYGNGIDTSAPIPTVTVPESGQIVQVAFEDDSYPLNCANPAAGFMVQRRPNSSASWVAASFISATLQYGNAIALRLIDPILPTEQVRVIYDAAVGTITDSSPALNETASFTQVAVNRSIYSQGVPGFGVSFLSTRGDGRVRSASGASFNGHDYQSFRKIELPYGAAPGWKVAFAGYSANIGSTVQVKGTLVTIINPGEAPVQIPLTFNGQSGGTAPNLGVLESDSIGYHLRPGGEAIVATWYQDSTGNGSPWQPWAVVNGNYLADDGIMVGNLNLTGDGLRYPLRDDSSHAAVTSGQGGLAKTYGPIGIVGQPSAEYTGHGIVVATTGDSISARENDWSAAPSIGVMDRNKTRGWQGRWADRDFPYVSFGVGGETSTALMQLESSGIFRYIFGDPNTDEQVNLRKVTHVIDEYGINLLRQQQLYAPNNAGAVAVWQSKTDVAALMLRHDLQTVITTLTPMTCLDGSGNPLWLAPDAGDTNYAQSKADFEFSRAAYNTRARAQFGTIPGVIGVFDFALQVESDPISQNNIWLTKYRSDGIHPPSEGHQRLVGACSLAPFSANPNPVFHQSEGVAPPSPILAASFVSGHPEITFSVSATSQIRLYRNSDLLTAINPVNGVFAPYVDESAGPGVTVTYTATAVGANEVESEPSAAVTVSVPAANIVTIVGDYGQFGSPLSTAHVFTLRSGRSYSPIFINGEEQRPGATITATGNDDGTWSAQVKGLPNTAFYDYRAGSAPAVRLKAITADMAGQTLQIEDLIAT